MRLFCFGPPTVDNIVQVGRWFGQLETIQHITQDPNVFSIHIILCLILTLTDTSTILEKLLAYVLPSKLCPFIIYRKTKALLFLGIWWPNFFIQQKSHNIVHSGTVWSNSFLFLDKTSRRNFQAMKSTDCKITNHPNLTSSFEDGN